MPWTSVISHRIQLTGQTEVQQAQAQNTGRLSHLTVQILVLNLNIYLMCYAALVRIWSRWPKSRTESQTDSQSRQKQRASEGRCSGVLTQPRKTNCHVPFESFSSRAFCQLILAFTNNFFSYQYPVRFSCHR